MNDFYEATLDREKSEMIVLILQDLNPAGFQCAHQGCVSVQYFEQAVYAGKLHAVYVGAEQFFLGSQYF